MLQICVNNVKCAGIGSVTVACGAIPICVIGYGLCVIRDYGHQSSDHVAAIAAQCGYIAGDSVCHRTNMYVECAHGPLAATTSARYVRDFVL